MSKFPERLKELRKKHGINQTYLSKYLNYGYTAIANYESGRNEPSFDVLIKISEYFEVSVDYLIGKSDLMMSDASITSEEAKLLNDYRKLESEQKRIIRDMIEILSKVEK